MAEIHYSFTELDSDASFALLGKAFEGMPRGQALYFDNHFCKGELRKLQPDTDVWIRKWQLIAHEKICLHKMPAPAGREKKLGLIYFLNPELFQVKNSQKTVPLNSNHNTIFYCSSAKLSFSVLAKQPFFAMDIAFTTSWLSQQFKDASTPFKNAIEQYIKTNVPIVHTQPCTVEEYRILHELKECSMERHHSFFVKSGIYNLLANFLTRFFAFGKKQQVQCAIQYDTMVKLGKKLTEQVKIRPRIEAIAKENNMSVPSLVRQFKMVYGKGIHEYYVEHKMELAKKMILEKKISVKKMAQLLGYKQVTPFIEVFVKHHGFTPGSLKDLIP